MPKEYSWFDHALIRIKDFGIIAGMVCTLVFFVGKLGNLPARLEANEADIEKLKANDHLLEAALAGLQKDVDYIVKSMDEMKEWNQINARAGRNS